MKSTHAFDLKIEVDTYLDRLDNNLILSNEESDELRDHFFCEVEALHELGLSEAEAFEVSKMRFGERELIQTEYQKVRPMKMISRYLMVGLMLFFSIRLVTVLIAYCSAVMFFLVNKLEVSVQTANVIDLGLKVGTIIGLLTCIYAGLKRGRISKWLLLAIPLLSLVGEITMPIMYSVAMAHDYSAYISIVSKAIMNSKIIMLISYLLSVGLFFVLWHKNGKSLQLSN